MTADHYLTLAACALGISACARWWIAERRANQASRSLAFYRAEHERHRSLLGCYRSRVEQLKADARWRIVRVDTEGRGPNADTFYHVPPPCPDGREAWFTDEQTMGAKLRPDTTAKRAYETPL